MSGQLYSLVVGNEIWLWSPAHEKILIFDKAGQHKEILDVESKTMKAFNARRVEDLWSAEEAEDKTRLSLLVKERAGEYVKVEPIGFFLYKGSPTYGFNTGLLSSELVEEQFYVQREGVLEEVNGNGYWKLKHCHLWGLSGDKVFVNDFSNTHDIKNVLID